MIPKQINLLSLTVTGLAFVFIPISLAGTVFGMNVQQINQTGPDISAFAVTAVFMIVGTLLLWAFFGVLASHRRPIASKSKEKSVGPWERRTLKERLLFIGITRERVYRWPERLLYLFLRTIWIPVEETFYGIKDYSNRE